MASEISPSRRLTAFSVLPVEPAVDAYVHSPPGGQHRGEPRVGFQFPGLGLGLDASDGLAVVIVDELDGAGAIPLCNSVHDLHPSALQRSYNASPVLDACPEELEGESDLDLGNRSAKCGKQRVVRDRGQGERSGAAAQASARIGAAADLKVEGWDTRRADIEARSRSEVKAPPSFAQSNLPAWAVDRQSEI